MSINWFEIPVLDFERALRDFYEQVLETAAIHQRPARDYGQHARRIPA